MRKSWFIFATFILLACALALLVVPAGAQNTQSGPVVIPRDSVYLGRTYSDWSAAWEQWAYSIPASKHPLFDNGNCNTAQSGPVFFLGGKYCYNNGTCSYTNVVRMCTIPSSKAIYFPIIESEDSALEEDVAENPGNPDFQQIAYMRSYAAGNMDPAVVSAWLDGMPIPQLQQRFRVQSTAFSFTLPADNYLAAIYPQGSNNFQAGTYYPAVDDGWFVMLSPLPPGRHTLHFRGTIGTFNLDVKYYLTITK